MLQWVVEKALTLPSAKPELSAANEVSSESSMVPSSSSSSQLARRKHRMSATDVSSELKSPARLWMQAAWTVKLMRLSYSRQALVRRAIPESGMHSHLHLSIIGFIALSPLTVPIDLNPNTTLSISIISSLRGNK
jgi:hypothetical protein